MRILKIYLIKAMTGLIFPFLLIFTNVLIAGNVSLEMILLCTIITIIILITSVFLTKKDMSDEILKKFY